MRFIDSIVYACSSLLASELPPVSIFIHNETGAPFEVVSGEQKGEMKAGESGLYPVVRDGGELRIDERIILKMDDSFFIDPIDPDNQVSGLGGPFLKNYGVPEGTEFAFTILSPNQGDTIENSTPVPIESLDLAPEVKAKLLQLTQLEADR